MSDTTAATITDTMDRVAHPALRRNERRFVTRVGYSSAGPYIFAISRAGLTVEVEHSSIEGGTIRIYAANRILAADRP